MNLPNQLTVGRLFLTIIFVGSVSSHWAYSNTVGLVVFVLAGVTDYLDGEIARRYGLETNFGRLMDPLVDKIMLAAAFICLVEDGAMWAWAAVVIISREFLITGLRLLATSRGIVISADKAGKHKTAWQMVTVIYFFLLLSVKEWPALGAAQAPWYAVAWHWGGTALIVLALVLTLYSGVTYVWRNRSLIEGT